VKGMLPWCDVSDDENNALQNIIEARIEEFVRQGLYTMSKAKRRMGIFLQPHKTPDLCLEIQRQSEVNEQV